MDSFYRGAGRAGTNLVEVEPGDKPRPVVGVIHLGEQRRGQVLRACRAVAAHCRALSVAVAARQARDY